MKRAAIALSVVALAGASPALAKPPPRRAIPAQHQSLRTLLLKCVRQHDQRACNKLFKLLNP